MQNCAQNDLEYHQVQCMVFVPIRKSSNDSDKGMLADKHGLLANGVHILREKNNVLQSKKSLVSFFL